jgi:5-methyltetrahydrofolate--homocysteine methyltransferase
MAFDPNMKLTRENFSELPPLCSDGAWGTELAKRGAQPGQMCDTWNVEQPDTIRALAKSYVDVGAQIVLTNTFNSNRIALERHGLAERAAELAQAGAAVSKQAAEGRAYVFASIGPCGKIIMMGEVTPEEIEASAAEQAAAMEAGGADAIIVETQSDLAEAEAALKGALGACAIPVGVSFTYEAGANNDHTMMGVSVPQAHELATSLGASFVGANCGAGIETFVNIAEQYAACGSELPIWIKGNAGRAEIDADGGTVYRAGPETYAEAVPTLLTAGARFIGGCCGSSPDHIGAVAAAMAANT